MVEKSKIRISETYKLIFFAYLCPLKLSNIMLIWCCLSIISLLIGLFLFPNQNLNQREPNLVQNDSLVSAVIRRQFKLTKGSLTGQFRERNVFCHCFLIKQPFQHSQIIFWTFQSLLYLKSPIFWVQLLTFSVGNCSVALGWVLNNLRKFGFNLKTKIKS